MWRIAEVDSRVIVVMVGGGCNCFGVVWNANRQTCEQ